MKRRYLRTVGFLALCLISSAVGAQKPEDEKVQRSPMFLTVELEGAAAVTIADPLKGITTSPGIPVKVRGVVSLDQVGRSVTITVTPPQGSSAPPGPKPQSD